MSKLPKIGDYCTSVDSLSQKDPYFWEVIGEVNDNGLIPCRAVQEKRSYPTGMMLSEWFENGNWLIAHGYNTKLAKVLRGEDV